MSYLSVTHQWPSGWYWTFERDFTHWALSIDVFRRTPDRWTVGLFESGMALHVGPFYVEGGFAYKIGSDTRSGLVHDSEAK